MLCAAGVLAAGCNKGPEVVVEDPYITVTPDHVEAAYEGQIFDIQVESNCAWTISKTDAEGTAIDWVKCDRATGKGNAAFRVRVYKNNTVEERRATVTLAYEGAKAFIDVVQALNPDPDKPDIPDIPDPPTPPTPPTGPQPCATLAGFFFRPGLTSVKPGGFFLVRPAGRTTNG